MFYDARQRHVLDVAFRAWECYVRRGGCLDPGSLRRCSLSSGGLDTHREAHSRAHERKHRVVRGRCVIVWEYLSVGRRKSIPVAGVLVKHRVDYLLKRHKLSLVTCMTEAETDLLTPVDVNTC